MGATTAIEWTDATWPIVQGCDPVSQGCVHCYAVPLLWRMMHNPDPKISGPLQGLVEKHVNAAGEEILRFTGKIALREDRLTWPLAWKQPRMIFVPSHGDLFHKDVPDSFIDKVFAVMALCVAVGHMLQVLTKRAERMRAYLSDPNTPARVSASMWELSERRTDHITGGWPLRNVWLGVSAEDQDNANARIPHLLATPAAVRFVSCEPLLGPIDLTRIRQQLAGESFATINALHHKDSLNKGTPQPGLNWIIAGGESGKGARPMHPDWARSLRDQCAAAGKLDRFFFKQWGAWAPSTPEQAKGVSNPRSGWQANRPHPCVAKAHELRPEAGAAFVEHLGKKAAGRLLDGVEHNGMPNAGCR